MFVIFTGPRERDTAHHPGSHGKTPKKSGGRRQEGETPRPGFPQERQRRAVTV